MLKKFFNSHNLYLAGLGAKTLNGILEIVGAVLLLSIDIKKWPSYIAIIFQGELLEDPNDFIANFFLNSIQKLDVSIQFSGFLYLLSHGLVKLFLVVSLLNKKYWAYPLSEVVLLIFILYQTYLYTNNGSIFILFLNAIDIMLMVLIWIEYKKVKENLEKS